MLQAWMKQTFKHVCPISSAWCRFGPPPQPCSQRGARTTQHTPVLQSWSITVKTLVPADSQWEATASRTKGSRVCFASQCQKKRMLRCSRIHFFFWFNLGLVQVAATWLYFCEMSLSRIEEKRACLKFALQAYASAPKDISKAAGCACCRRMWRSFQ